MQLQTENQIKVLFSCLLFYLKSLSASFWPLNAALLAASSAGFLATHLLIPPQDVFFWRVLNCTMTMCRGSLSITWAHNFLEVSSPVGISLIRGESEYKWVTFFKRNQIKESRRTYFIMTKSAHFVFILHLFDSLLVKGENGRCLGMTSVSLQRRVGIAWLTRYLLIN